MSKWITKEEIRTITELYLNGWTAKQIAEHMQFKLSRVYRIMQTKNLKNKRKIKVNEEIEQYRKELHFTPA